MRFSGIFLIPNFAPNLEPMNVIDNKAKINNIFSNKNVFCSSERTVKCENTAIGTTIIMMFRLEPIEILVFSLPNNCNDGT